MATLLELEQKGWLWKLTPELSPRELELRTVLVSKVAKNWIANKLPLLESRWKSEIEPAAQLDDLLTLFCTGDRLKHGKQFHVLQPRYQGVWELKTPDLRLFGWFPERDCFVVVCCEEAGQMKARTGAQLDLYRKSINQVVGFRQSLPLDDPKFVTGVDPYGVVSNFT